MNKKSKIIRMLRDEFERWDELLTGLSEEQITGRKSPSALSIKDVIGHLRAWQQISIARLEAALSDRDPWFPEWLAGMDPFDAESDENRDNSNETIFQAYREQPWSDVYQVWREGFLHFLELAETIPRKELFETGRYEWLKEYPLSDVLLGSYEHHEEHFEDLQAQFGKYEN